MSEWIQKSLGEITSYLAKGIPPKYVDELNENTIYVLNQKCNRDFVISYEQARIHDLQQKKVSEEKMIKPGDVLINSTGEGTAGRIAQIWDIPHPTTTDGHMILIRPTEEVDKLYYGYAVKANQVLIESLAEGSTGQTEVNKKRLQDEVIISFPVDKEEQHRIALMLEDIDRKIAINNQINRNLHEQLNALYSNQFEPYVMSEDIPEGWTFVTLGEVAEVKNGCAFKGSDFTEDGTVPVIKIKNVKPYKILLNSVDYVNEETVVGKDKFKIKHGDLLITMTGNRMDGSPDSWVGKVAVFDVYGNYYLNQRVGIIAPDTTKISTYYLSEFLSSWTMQKYFIERATSSGGQANISPDIIKSIAFAIPSKKEMEEFEGLAKVYYLQIAKNQDEIDKLISLRDSLLPKLMSGELDISDFDI